MPEARFVIEQAPAWSDSADHGVVAEGAVGARALGRFKLFRYEIRLWRDGVIPDVAEAADSPHLVSDDADCARRLLELVPLVPAAVWGRDELRTGEMWNSNSVISWLIARSGLDVETIHPPLGGRAPGWRAGIVTARRQEGRASHSCESKQCRERPRRLVRFVDGTNHDRSLNVEHSLGPQSPSRAGWPVTHRSRARKNL